MDERDEPARAREPGPKDVARIGRALNEAGAKYVLIGGLAMNAHGFRRTTQDVDLLVEDTAENMQRVKQALGVLADNAVSEVRDTDVREYVVVRVADEVVVDLMGRACGVTYQDAARDAEEIEIEGVPIRVASKKTLIRTKNTYRATDISDRQVLEQLIADRGRSR